ncbi:hypothetical protein [Zobellia laminariae]|uniref:hypothetical protein n=1 Tax=Zobellia laminariae TaxID=248906 RepID=UPI0026F46C70|nr:hypothetical protein [Zobellia laminariae]WKX77289.1 hypothetical protein Q5W13_04135 [Zobellia laminariae]
MKIRYKKKRLRVNLFIVIAWGVLVVLTLFFSSKRQWFDYVYFIMLIFHLAQYIYENKKQYLTIENGTISKNLLFQTKKMNLNEITQIKKFAGDYILKSKLEELTITTQIIDADSLVDLNAALEQLELPADRTPFTRPIDINI